MNVYLATKCINSLQVCGDITNRFTRRTSDISKLFWAVQYCLSDFEASRVFCQLFVPKIFWTVQYCLSDFEASRVFLELCWLKYLFFMHSKDCKEMTNHFHFLLLILCSIIKYSLFKLNLIILVMNMTLNHISKSAITFLNTIVCSEI